MFAGKVGVLIRIRIPKLALGVEVIDVPDAVGMEHAVGLAKSGVAIVTAGGIRHRVIAHISIPGNLICIGVAVVAVELQIVLQSGARQSVGEDAEEGHVGNLRGDGVGGGVEDVGHRVDDAVLLLLIVNRQTGSVDVHDAVKILIDAETHGKETVVEVHSRHDVALHLGGEEGLRQNVGIGDDGTHGVGKVLEHGRGDTRPDHLG